MKAFKILLVICCMLVSGFMLMNETAIAASYPDKPVEFIAPASPGGGWDMTCRMSAKALKDAGLVKQPITVINKPGGFGMVVMTDILRNRKNDNNVLVAFSSVLTTQMATKKNPYTYKDITPVAALFVDYGVLAVRKDSKYTTFKEFVEEFKKLPGALVFGGSSGPGGLDHMRVAMIARELGLSAKSIKYVAFQGGGEALGALLGGHITAFVGEAGEISAQVEAGTVRPLALLADKKLTGAFAKTPLAKNEGVNVVSPNWRGFYAPPEVSKDVLTYWETTLGKMVKTKEWKEVLKSQSWVDYFLTGDAVKKFINDELSMYEKLAKELGLVE